MSEELKRERRETEELSFDEKQALILEYTPLVRYIAQKISLRLPPNVELDDLVSSGIIGLMDAIDRYDLSRDNQFKTYAEFRIRGAILDELRSQDWVPRSIREKAKKLERTHSRLEQKYGRRVSDQEMAAELGLEMDAYFKLLNEVSFASTLSIDEMGSFASGDRKSFLNLLEGCKFSNPYKQLDLKATRELIARAINELPEKQRLVLALYYYEELNLKEIGRVLEVTESRISQLHTQAIQKLKIKLKTYFEEQ